jgi:hypothetical protein
MIIIHEELVLVWPSSLLLLGPILPSFAIEGKGHGLGYFFNGASCLA